MPKKLRKTPRISVTRPFDQELDSVEKRLAQTRSLRSPLFASLGWSKKHLITSVRGPRLTNQPTEDHICSIQLE